MEVATFMFFCKGLGSKDHSDEVIFLNHYLISHRMTVRGQFINSSTFYSDDEGTKES